MKFSNLKIGTRLGLAFLLLILLTIICNSAAWMALNEVGNKWQTFSSVSMEKRKFASNGSARLGDAVHHFKDYVLRGGDYNKNFVDDLKEISSNVDGYFATGDITDQEKSLLNVILQGCESYGLAMDKAVAMKSKGSSIEEIDKSVNGADKEMARGWAGLLDVARQEAVKTGTSITGTISFGQTVIEIFAMIVVILSALSAWLITRSVTKPISQAVEIAQTVASGNLSLHIDIQSTDEVGQLLSALEDMNDSLKNIVAEVLNSADTIASASSQIAIGNLDLSSRTEEQASSLEETASSMEELTSAVKENANNASHANRLAENASRIAVKGGTEVLKVVQTMEMINDSSEKIVDIINVIDSIAFQTNILALNASVEAARAGEQGRGFAVVAAEIRNLAQRCADAAKQIKTLITDSVEKVDNGAKLVDQAGTTMGDVVNSVKQLTDIIGKIMVASAEQASGIEHINQAIMQMDDVTQQNAALVEEAAAASQSLEDQTATLVDVVSIFKLNESHNSAAENKKRATPIKQIKTAESLPSLPRSPKALAYSMRDLPKIARHA